MVRLLSGLVRSTSSIGITDWLLPCIACYPLPSEDMFGQNDSDWAIYNKIVRYHLSCASNPPRNIASTIQDFPLIRRA